MRLHTGKKSKEEAERNAIEEEALKKIVVELEAGRGARNASLTSDEALLVKNLGLLTLKQLIYAANVGEDDLGNHGANNIHVQVKHDLELHCAAAVACRLLEQLIRPMCLLTVPPMLLCIRDSAVLLLSEAAPAAMYAA